MNNSIGIEYAVFILALFLIFGCLTYWIWEMKGVIIYIGVVTTILGLILIYLGFTDKII